MAKPLKKKSSRSKAKQVEPESFLETDFVLSRGKLALLQALVIICAGWWVAAPALHGDFIRDDRFYLTSALLNDPDRLWQIWFQPGSFIEYYPITQTVQWLQWQFWGSATTGYHVTNLVLHIANALLVWRLLAKLNVPLAWLGGLIFVAHPAQVESVAWISELKNTLSLGPFLLAMMAWIDYEDRKRPRDYRWALGLFVIAMLCKTSMALFPVVMLVYAWWKRDRIDARDLARCVPFLAVSLLLGALSLWAGVEFAQNNMAPSPPAEAQPLSSRLVLVGTTLSFYFSKFFWPGRMLPTYPQWSIEPVTFFDLVPLLLLAGALYFCWTQRKSWGRHALLGLAFFAINIAPFLGLSTVSYMKYSWVMDHLLYLPLIGLIGLAVAAIGNADARVPFSARPLVRGAVTLLLTLMAFQAHAYSEAYVDELTLWEYALEYNPDSPGVRASLGGALAVAGKYPEAIEQYKVAVALQPNDSDMHEGMANLLARSGNLAGGLAEYEEALRLNPKDASTLNNMGFALGHAGQFPEAIDKYGLALDLRPNDPEIHYNLAVALTRAGRLPEAEAEFHRTLALRPNYPNAHNNLGFVLSQMGRIPEAIEQLEMARQLDPGNAAVQNNLDQLRETEKTGAGSVPK